MRSSVWHYHRFPLHDPWMCGGLDLLANPQSRILSPLGLFDIVFPPAAANWLSLAALSVAGAFGAFRLYRELSGSVRVAAVLACLFVNGSWFTLHFAEGHIPFGPMLLLPWIALCVRHWESRRWRVLCAALIAGMALSGAAYACIFSLYLFATCWALGWGRAPFRDPWATLCLATGTACVIAAKAVPAFAAGTVTERVSAFERMPFGLIARALLSPVQRLSVGDAGFGFHEYGCYLGVVALLIACLARDWRVWAAAAFWLWVASGIGGMFNPWSVHAHLPIVGVARVQSRLLILFFVFFLALLGEGLARVRWQTAALVFLVVECLVIRTDTLSAAYRFFPGTPIHGLITRDRLDATINDAVKPTHYLVPQALGTVQCYEMAFLQVYRRAEASEWTGYRGEAWADTGSAHIRRYTPGEITVDVSPGDNTITLNTNTLAGWRVDKGTVDSHIGELLRLRTRAPLIHLTYAPRYWWPMWLLLTLGLVLLAAPFVLPKKL